MTLWINDQIRLPDGRVGTVTYHGLDGDGIKWGLHDVPLEDLEGTCGGVLATNLPLNHPSWKWLADAMLRSPEVQKYFSLPCVGEEFEIIRKCEFGKIPKERE
jgi:hypothetical protein